jgi:hypothetical protein
VSFLDEKGRPSITERLYVLPPGSQIGPIGPEQRKALLASSVVAGVYERTEDRESAYEKLKGRATEAAEAGATGSTGGAAGATTAGGGALGGLSDVLFGTTGPRGGKREGLVESFAKSAIRTIGSSVGREIARGVLGSILGGKR